MGRLIKYLPMIIAGVKWVNNRRQQQKVVQQQRPVRSATRR